MRHFNITIKRRFFRLIQVDFIKLLKDNENPIMVGRFFLFIVKTVLKKFAAYLFFFVLFRTIQLQNQSTNLLQKQK